MGRVPSHHVSSWTRFSGCCGFRGVFWVGQIFFQCLFFRFFFFERTQPAASMMTPCLIYFSTSTWVRTGCHYLIGLPVGLCVTFVVFSDCESCTMPISTNPGSMEVGEYGLTRGTCFIARRLELVSVAGLLWISWCVVGGQIFPCFFFFPIFFSSIADGLLQV